LHDPTPEKSRIVSITTVTVYLVMEKVMGKPSFGVKKEMIDVSMDCKYAMHSQKRRECGQLTTGWRQNRNSWWIGVYGNKSV
jgi:hypothetical protein